MASNSGQGAWRLFDNEGNLANHLRAMAIAETEVQRILRILGSEGRVMLEEKSEPAEIERSSAPPPTIHSR